MIGRQLQHHQCFHEPKLNLGSGKIVKGKCVEPFKKIVGIQHSLIYITKGAFLKKSPLDSLLQSLQSFVTFCTLYLGVFISLGLY